MLALGKWKPFHLRKNKLEHSTYALDAFSISLISSLCPENKAGLWCRGLNGCCHSCVVLWHRVQTFEPEVLKFCVNCLQLIVFLDTFILELENAWRHISKMTSLLWETDIPWLVQNHTTSDKKNTVNGQFCHWLSRECDAVCTKQFSVTMGILVADRASWENCLRLPLLWVPLLQFLTSASSLVLTPIFKGNLYVGSTYLNH